MVRKPAVAGMFYPGTEEELRREVASLVAPAREQQRATGVISPHAGYVYSGKVAGALFGGIRIPSTVIILGPNHHGIGAAAAIFPAGEWSTPLGNTRINGSLARLLMAHVPLLQDDQVAHSREHSLEVQLPFIQYLNPDAEIVPVCLGFGDFPSCRALANGIASAIREYGEEVLIVASSDMTHYESAESAREKDEAALQQALGLNAEGLLQVCRTRRITMCGVIPSAVMILAAAELGATRAELVQYATSGDVSGDNRQVVGYAAVRYTT